MAGVLVASTGWAAPEPKADAVDSEFFETKIRPVLAEKCYACHTGSKLGGLRADSREALLKGGKNGPAIVPGKADESLLIRSVRHEMEDLKMPMGGKLAATEIAALVDWVNGGAPWPEAPDAVIAATDDGFEITPEQQGFWSFQPLDAKAPGEAQSKFGKKWARNYIDRFVLAKLEEKELTPVGEADRRTLIRRATLDLLGLPPTPEEVEAFVTDKDPEAYEKLIDRLLASPHYGERWGRHWLDVVRYGEDDTRGLAKGRKGFEPYSNAYLYRDWVVKAFNDDMPYDTFVKAQIAADLLGKTEFTTEKSEWDEYSDWGRLKVPGWEEMEDDEKRKYEPYGHLVDPELNKDLLPALGLLGQGPWYYDLGDARQMRSEERNDRVDVVTRGFLGVTVACARCHDHKYDPFSMQDYYGLAGVFHNSTYHEYPLEKQARVDEWRRRNEIVKAQKERIGKFKQEEAKQYGRMLAYRTKDYLVGVWRVEGDPKMNVEQAAAEGRLDTLILRRWIAFTKKEPKHYPYLIEWHQLIADGGDIEAAELQAELFQERLLKIMDEWEELSEKNKKIYAKAWPLEDPPPIPMPNEFKTSFEKYHIVAESMPRERANLYTDVFFRDLDAPDANEYMGRKPGVLRLEDWQLERFITGDKREYLETLQEDLKKLEKWRGEQYPFVLGVRDAHVLTELPLHKRGSPMNLGDPVERRFIEVLGGKAAFEKGSGRLELAEAIAEHPLTARVITNRVWKWHFGTGIVNTPSNFGMVGERPSHPEMLEYIAQRFVDNGMSIKKLHKDLMLSATYRLRSSKNDGAYAVDPENRLYWRYSRQRLDAESIRDSMLYVTGVLDDKVGGKSGDIDDPDFKRRSIYGKVSRFLLADYFKVFDFPNPNNTAPQRFVTTIPQQRLFFMNSEFVFNQANAFVARLEKVEAKKDQEKTKKDAADKTAETAEAVKLSDEAKIQKAYALLYGRSPTAEEMSVGLAFLKDEANRKREADTNEVPLTPWNQYARVLLSSNEFVFRN